MACNGKTLAIVPARGDLEHPGPIPTDALREARKRAGGHRLEVKAESVELADGRTFPRPKDAGKFPDWRRAVPLPIADDVNSASGGEERTVAVDLDVNLLRDLLEALGGGARSAPVTLVIRQKVGVDGRFTTPGPVLAIGAGGRPAVGVIMPMLDGRADDGQGIAGATRMATGKAEEVPA